MMKGKQAVQRAMVGVAAFTLLAGIGTAARADGLPPIYDTTAWETFAIDEDGTDPGGGGQLFDTEYLAYRLDGNQLSIGLQTGFDLSDGIQRYGRKFYYAGDLALSFDGAVTLGDASTYEYAVDFGFLTRDYYHYDPVGGNTGIPGLDHAGLYEVSDWNNDVKYTASVPFAMESGTFISGLQANTYWTGNNGDSYFRYVSFDLSSLGLSVADGLSIDAHWTMSCGNDNINGNFDVAPVPEPATMLLFGTGLAGLAGALRRKKQQQDD